MNTSTNSIPQILYVGNILSKHGFTPTTIESLSPILSRLFGVTTCSNKKNKALRLAHMITTIFKHRRTTDLVLIDTYSSNAFFFALVAAVVANLLGIKYVPIIHGGAFPARFQSSPKLCRFLFTRSVTNVTVSGYMSQVLNAEGLCYSEIPNFIRVSEYPYLHRSQTELRILFVRSLQHIYNPKLLLNAFLEIKEAHPKAKLCFVGPDKDGSILELSACVNEHGLQSCVSFTGRLEKAEWISLSKEFDLFVNPTRVDNLPVSVIEAMALGFPVISTAVGGIPHLIEHELNGLLFDGQKALVEAMVRLNTNPALTSKLSENARLTAEKYDVDRCERLWVQLIKRLIQD